MTTRSVEEHLRDPGYTPSVKHAPKLLALLAGDDDDTAARAARALVKLGDVAAQRALEAFPTAVAPARGRLVDLFSDLARAGVREDELRALLLATLDDDDAKSRRNAVIALGHHERPEVERALLDYWRREARPDHRRSVARSLAKIGGAPSLALLRLAPVDDPELQRVAREAVLMLERRAVRDDESVIAGDAKVDGAHDVTVRCRRGLEALCEAEFDPAQKPRTIGAGRIAVSLRGPLSEVFRARTMTWMGFDLTPRPLDGRDAADVLAEAITSDEALAIFRRFTRGSLRYRIEWVGAGHRRGATARTVERVSRVKPMLVNDSRESTWEVSALEHEGRLLVELVPLRLDDPRFVYRVAEVPAASHPSLAAALVRVAHRRDTDIVWDPFVGSGLELCERARFAPYAQLWGRDTDPRAVAAARANLASAKAERATIEEGNAFDPAPKGVTLILTNPPLGGRVGFGENVALMLEDFVAHAAASLAPGGRMVWVSPVPARTERAAKAAGLAVTYRQRVALPGFDTEIQRYDRVPPRAERPARRANPSRR